MYRLCSFSILILCSFAAKTQNFYNLFQISSTFNTHQYSLINYQNEYKIALTKYDQANSRNTINYLSVDSAGNVLNAYEFQTVDSNYSISILKMYQAPDGSILLNGIYSINNNTPYYPVIISLDAQGNLNWCKQLAISSASFSGMDFITLSNNEILGSLKYNNGNATKIFFKLDSAGILSDFYKISPIKPEIHSTIAEANAFRILFSDGNFYEIANDLSSVSGLKKFNNVIGVRINKMSGGGYILATAQRAFPGHMTISKLDAGLNAIWSKYVVVSDSLLGDFDVTGLHFIKELNSGNILVVARSEGGLNGSVQVLLDGNGNYISNYKTTNFHNEYLTTEDTAIVYTGFQNVGTFNSSDLNFARQSLSPNSSCLQVLNHSVTDSIQLMLAVDSISLISVPAITTIDVPIKRSTIQVNQSDYCSPLYIKDSYRKIPDLSIYPNPASDKLTVRSSFVIEAAELFSFVGKSVRSFKGNEIALEGLESGIYILRVKIEGQFYNKRIVKY